MADLEVIYDPAKEMAAIVNIDTRQGWGPAMIGPDAGLILQAFIDAMPFDISTVSEYSATQAFQSFLGRVVGAPAEAPATDHQGAVERAGDPDLVQAAAAEAEAHSAGDGAVAPGPADIDPDASAGTAVEVVPCFNCNGAGMIEFGGDEPSQRCNMCQGTGRITQPARAQA